jgi:hypothetical protein
VRLQPIEKGAELWSPPPPTVGIFPWRGRRAALQPWGGSVRGGGGVRLAQTKEEEEAKVGHVG